MLRENFYLKVITFPVKKWKTLITAVDDIFVQIFVGPPFIKH